MKSCFTFNITGGIQEVRINHGGHGVPRSFNTKIIYSSVYSVVKNSSWTTPKKRLV